MAKWCWVGVSVDAGVQPRSARRRSLLPFAFSLSDLCFSRIDRLTFPSDRPTVRPSHRPTFPSD